MHNILIVMPTFNGGRYLIDQLNSILNQDYPLTNLIVFDDKSTDDTVNILKKNSIKYLINSQNAGSASQNILKNLKNINLSDYEYLAFADQDDIWMPNKLSKAISTIIEKKIDGYSSNVKAFWENGREAINDKSYPQTDFDFLFESAGPGCSYVVKTSLIIEMMKFIENTNIINKINHHDLFIYSYARANKYKWFIDPDVTLYYRQHNTNYIGDNIGLIAKIRRLNLIRSGEYLKQIRENYNVFSSNKIINHDFIFSSRLQMIRNFNHLRRNPRDKYLFLILLLFCNFTLI